MLPLICGLAQFSTPVIWMGITLAFIMIFVLLVFIVSPISLLTVSRFLSIVSRSLAELDVSIILSENLRWVSLCPSILIPCLVYRLYYSFFYTRYFNYENLRSNSY